MPRTFSRALLAGCVALAVIAPGAGAATTTARTELLRALASVKAAGDHEAAAALARATSKQLWINDREVVAPAYGLRVFRSLSGAIRHTPASSPAVGLIVDAARRLAATVIEQAHASRRGLVRGDRAAAAGQAAKAIGDYTGAWTSAFAALTRLVTHKVTSVPAAKLAAAAANALGSKKIDLAGPSVFLQNKPPLVDGGKPEIFFAGSEACPFCGVERWGMIVALAQLGKFSNLSLMQSDTTDRPADRTFTFFGSSYQSPYVSFVPVEFLSNVRKGFAFEHLQPLTAGEQALLNEFDPQEQTPFIDVANRFVKVDSTTRPRLIANESWTRLANALESPKATSTQAIAGTAEVLTAEICESTNGAPQSICAASIVKQYEAALPLLNGHGGGCPLGQTSTSQARRRRGQPPLARAARCVQH